MFPTASNWNAKCNVGKIQRTQRKIYMNAPLEGLFRIRKVVIFFFASLVQGLWVVLQLITYH